MGAYRRTLGLASAIAVSAVLAAAPALANNGKGKGAGNGKGHGNSIEKSADAKPGNGYGRGNGGGGKGVSGSSGKNWASHAKDKPAKRGKALAAKVPPGQQKKLARAEARAETLTDDGPQIKNGTLRSSMGSLNAAHANIRALENASPNSRVGKLAIYREKMIEAAVLQGDLNTALQDFVAAGYSEEDLSNLDGLVGDIEAELAEVDDLRAEIEAIESDPTFDPETPPDGYLDLLDDLALAEDGLSAPEEDLRNQLDTLTAVRDLPDDIDLARMESMDYLSAAANKPLNEEFADLIIAEVNRLLGIEKIDPFDPFPKETLDAAMVIDAPVE